MKVHSLSVAVGFSVLLMSCSATHSMVKSGLPDHGPGIRVESFSGFGKTTQTKNGVELTIASAELFHKKSSHLTKAGTAKVDAIAAALLKYPDAKVLVIAFTDNVGTDMKNVKFSQAQAARIMARLVQQGVPAADLNAEGNGPVEAVAPNDDEADRAKNRRVLFEINAF